MRLTSLILLISILHVSAKGLSQKVNFTRTKITLKQALNEIKQQTGYSFLGDQTLLEKAPLISVSLKDATITEALDQCLKGMAVTYQIKDRFIYLRTKKEVSVLLNAAPPAYTISGQVLSSKGLPLEGIAVQVKELKRSANTDSKGSFSFTGVTPGSYTLLVTGVSYQQQTISVKAGEGLEPLHIVLEEFVNSLDETVVTAYGRQTKTSQTGSITQIKGSEVADIPLTSVDKALQGRVAGLQSVGGSGQPGSSQDIRIRGIGSFSASAAPLFVVDGIPINTGTMTNNTITTTSNPLSGINPDDIETISVLKDASASSIYGSRAANGVIIITTRKGRAGVTKITINGEAGSSVKGYMSEKNRPLTTEEWKTLTMEGLLNNPSEVAAHSLTKDNVGAYVDQTFRTNNGVNTNWLDVVTRTGTQRQVNVAADGGNEKTQFHVSGGYFKQEGIVLASAFDRYSVNVNLTHKATDRLTFSTNMVISRTSLAGPSNGGAPDNPVLAAYFLLPMYSPRNADGTPNITAPDFPASGNSNPVAIAEMDKRNTGTLKGLGSVSGEYKILPGLRFTSKYGIDYNNVEEDRYFNPYYGGYQANFGAAYRSYSRYFNWVWTNLFDYATTLMPDHSMKLNLKAGYEAQKSRTYLMGTQVTGMVPSMDIQVPSAAATFRSITGNNSDYAFASMLALGDVSYKDRYVLSASYRRDGSSRFGDKNRYGNFWSVGAAWNIDKEAFMAGVSWVNLLKLRASYGVNGNAGIGDYDWRPLYAYGTAYNYLGGTGSAPIVVGNLNLTWETNKPLDIGIDFATFKNRLNITAEWYTRKTTDLLLGQPLSLTTGFSSFSNNIGAVKNSGIELAISGTPVIAGDFRWDLHANFSHNTNKIQALVNGTDQVPAPFIRRVGEDFQSFYLPLWAGVDPANGNPLWYTDGSKSATTSNYNLAKSVILGSASPKYFGGFGSTFSYKGFSLDALFYYNFGNLVRDTYAKYQQSDGQNPAYNRVAVQLERWQKPGDQTNTPKYVYNGNQASNSNSSRYLYKGDYVRLRNVTLAYQFPKRLLSALKIGDAKLYVRGTNILTWVKDKNLTYDPETAITSTTLYDVYIPKTYTVGINIGL